MRLLAELGGAADDAVVSFFNFGDKTCTVTENLKHNAVADSDRVGLLAASNAEIAPQTAG